MADLSPTAVIAVADDRQAFGQVTSKDECVTWDLRAYLSYGKGGASFTGLTLDPTGQYVLQADVPVALDADPSQWTGLAGATYSFGTDSGGTSAGKKFLRGVATGTAAMTGVSSYSRVAEEGLVLGLYRSAVGAGIASDFFLNFQPSGGSGPQYRLALVPGLPLQLQTSTDGNSWAVLRTLEEMGEIESYLDSHSRSLTITVVPMTDPTWAAGLPDSAAQSGPPPSLLVINVNSGDGIMSVPCTTFAADFLAGFTAHGGQFSLRISRRRYAASASATLPAQVRSRNFAVDAVARFQGYIPYASTLTAAITTDGANQAAGSLTLDASSEADATGYAVHSVCLSALDADFPAGQVSPSESPAWDTYAPCLASARVSWDQKTGTLRSSGSVTLLNSGNALSPGVGVSLGVRAGALQFGYSGFSGSEDFRSSLQPVLTGWTGLDASGGQEWFWQASRNFVRISVHDKLRRGDADQIACGYRLPDDGQNHYYAMRTGLHTLGITDDWMSFPLRNRDDTTQSEFFLPRGTTLEPLMQAHPSTPVGSHLETVRSVSGVYADPSDSTSQILPMALGTNPQGFVEYFGLPVGVVQAFGGSAAGLTPQITFGGAAAFWPDGSPMLNELLELETRATLTNIRSDIVFEGLDIASGGAVVGVAKDESLGGPNADPSKPGYVSLPVPFYDINKLYSSAEVAGMSAQIAAIQLQFPAIEARLKVYLQPWLAPLSIIAVEDFATTGSSDAVYFYITDIEHVYDGLTDPAKPTGYSFITARLLGQAG